MKPKSKFFVAAFFLLGLGEAAYVSTLLSIFFFSPMLRVFLSLVLALTALGTTSLWSSSNFRPPGWVSHFLSRLLENSGDPRKSRLYLHSIFCWAGFVNSGALIFFGFAGSLYRFPDPAWGFLAGIAIIETVFYYRSVLNAFGLSLEDNRGSSLILAASMAALAKRMLAQKKSSGLTVLRQSLKMAGKIFNYRQHRPIDFLDVSATLEGLADNDKDLPFPEMEKLADSLTGLPKRSELPGQFRQFLDEVKWPGGFERLETEKTSLTGIVKFFLASLTAIGTFLVVVPPNVQQQLYTDFVGFVVQQGLGWGALLVFLAGAVYTFRTLTYAIPITYVKSESQLTQ